MLNKWTYVSKPAIRIGLFIKLLFVIILTSNFSLILHPSIMNHVEVSSKLCSVFEILKSFERTINGQEIQTRRNTKRNQ